VEFNSRFNPFPGLRSFEEDEDYLFFGREEQTDELLKKLGNTHFLAVIGSSGSGKSSLVKSGLLPYLHSGYMAKAGSSWRVALTRPGNDPVGNVARALAGNSILYDDIDESNQTMYSSIIESTLRRSTLGLAEAVKQSNLSSHENLLVVIDQFEELFRFNRYEKKNQEGKRDSLHFISLLLNASQQRDVPIYVVFTMRSDFLGECTQFRGLPEAINQGQYLIPRMTREERKSAISGPVAVGGASMAPRLLTRLLNDVGDNPDQLPILQHSLMRTWDHWKETSSTEEPIDLQHYKAIGTMEKSLSLHAEEAYSELKTDKEKKLCETLFKSLTDKGANGQGIRRPCKMSEICAISNADISEIIPIIETFRKPSISFLMPPANVKLNENSIIDISHESLMRVWTRLIGWVEEETQSAEIYLRLSEAAALYHEGKSDLWTGPELQLTLNWKGETKLNDIWANRYDPSYERAFLFLDYSKDAYQTTLEQKEKRRKAVLKRTRLFAAILGIAFLISILFLIFAVDQHQKARQSAEVAVEQKNIAEQEEGKATEMQKLAEESQIEAVAAKEEAVKEKDNAVKQRKLAEFLRIVADDAKDKALNAKIEADILRGKAEEAKIIAEALRIEADSQKNEAVVQKELAVQRKIEADIAKEKAERLRLLEIGHSLAIQTLRIEKSEHSELTSLLALTSYNFNKNYNGDVNDADVFNALYFAAENKDEDLFDKHQDAVRVLTYSPDGKQFASGGDDGKVMLWNSDNPKKQIQVFNVPGDGYKNIRTLNFAADRLIASTAGGALLAWDKNGQNKVPLVISELGSSIKSISINQENGTIAAGNDEGEILIWKNGDLLNPADTIVRLGEKLNTIEFVPEKNELAITLEKSGLVFIDMKGNTTREIYANGKQFYSLGFSNNGKWLAVGTIGGNILLWDYENDLSAFKELNAHNSGISAFAFKPDSKVLASSGRDQSIKLWDLDHLDNQPRTLMGHEKWIWDIDFSPDGNTVISGGSDNDIRKWLVNIELLSEKLEEKLCRKLGRNFTQEEWDKYIGEDVKYEKTCSDKN
jgi:WD40 repeat protein